MSELNTHSLGLTRRCPVCKKEFLLRGMNHAYKITRRKGNTVSHLYICSWRCLREYEAKHESKAAKNKKQKIQEQLMGRM